MIIKYQQIPFFLKQTIMHSHVKICQLYSFFALSWIQIFLATTKEMKNNKHLYNVLHTGTWKFANYILIQLKTDLLPNNKDLELKRARVLVLLVTLVVGWDTSLIKTPSRLQRINQYLPLQPFLFNKNTKKILM